MIQFLNSFKSSPRQRSTLTSALQQEKSQSVYGRMEEMYGNVPCVHSISLLQPFGGWAHEKHAELPGQ